MRDVFSGPVFYPSDLRQRFGAHREPPLYRPFSSFPGGWAATGLLLLRLFLGVSLLTQATFAFAGGNSTGFHVELVELLMAVTGTALILGLMTTAAGLIAAAVSLDVAIYRLPVSIHGWLDPSTAAINAIAISLALVCLGPGALSADAHLFGRREIIIPSAPPKS